MKILVTGGTGFIGSHTCVELLDAGYEVVIIDNLYNSKREVAQRIEQISGHHVSFYEEDCLDEQALERIFTEHKIDAVIHFAGYKAVGESVAKPLMYYENNLMSTLNLCKVMRRHTAGVWYSLPAPRYMAIRSGCRSMRNAVLGRRPIRMARPS